MGAKILCACANGSGTSLMMQLTVERVANKLGMDVTQVHHCALAEGTSTAKNFDVVCFPRNFENMFDAVKASGKVVCIPLKNVLSDKEVEEKFVENGLDKKFAK
ncbi:MULTISPECIES: PTS sugar transporter subunit IIB [Olsenella]|uniref:PTS sugar transporter subunit IIB n=1 Tax=Olsenella TaxID=133925 RepID=UPI0007859F8D|nr:MULTISPECIES: PTS sugar transporter subunit IIB [Olsenella]